MGSRPGRPSLPAALLLALLPVLLTACATPGPAREPADDAGSGPTAGPAPTTGPATAPGPAPTLTPEPGTSPPPWLGERVLPLAEDGYGVVRPTPPALRERRFTRPAGLPPLPGRGYASRATTPAPDRVVARSSWRPECPVAREDLSWLRVALHGFAGERHTGEALVHADAVEDLRQVFAELWRAGFPIERMRITRAAEVDAPPTGDDNNTTVLVCRQVTGGGSWSEHARGLAIDVNPFQNPYRRGDRVLPELASAYLDRGNLRPGMVRPDGPVARAFARVGWEWGGAWHGLVDHQHFSRDGT